MLDDKTTALIRSTHRLFMPDTVTFRRAHAPRDTFGQPVDDGAGVTITVPCLFIVKTQKPASDQEGDQKLYSYSLKVAHDAGALQTDTVTQIVRSTGAIEAGSFRVMQIRPDAPTGPVLMMLVDLERVQ